MSATMTDLYPPSDIERHAPEIRLARRWIAALAFAAGVVVGWLIWGTGGAEVGVAFVAAWVVAQAR